MRGFALTREYFSINQRRSNVMFRTVVICSVSIAVLIIAGLALRHLLADISWSDVIAAVHAIPRLALAASTALTIISYLILTGFDVLALQLVGRSVPYPTTALAAFTSYIFSHNFGFAALTGGASRYRIYRRYGVPLTDVGQVMIIAGVTFWLGAFLLLGIAFLIQPHLLPIGGFAIPMPLRTTAGWVILMALAGYVAALIGFRGRAVRLWRWDMRMPTWRMALIQFALGTLDLLAATAVLFVLLPDLELALYPTVLAGYLVAIISSLLAHAPGGLGVFEVIMIAALPQVDRTGLIAALLTFRIIYYFIPLAVGILLFACHEVMTWGKPRVPQPNPV